MADILKEQPLVFLTLRIIQTAVFPDKSLPEHECSIELLPEFRALHFFENLPLLLCHAFFFLGRYFRILLESKGRRNHIESENAFDLGGVLRCPIDRLQTGVGMGCKAVGRLDAGFFESLSAFIRHVLHITGSTGIALTIAIASLFQNDDAKILRELFPKWFVFKDGGSDHRTGKEHNGFCAVSGDEYIHVMSVHMDRFLILLHPVTPF